MQCFKIQNAMPVGIEPRMDCQITLIDQADAYNSIIGILLHPGIHQKSLLTLLGYPARQASWMATVSNGIGAMPNKL